MNKIAQQQAKAIANFWMMSEQEYLEKLIEREYRCTNDRVRRSRTGWIRERWSGISETQIIGGQDVSKVKLPED